MLPALMVIGCALAAFLIGWVIGYRQGVIFGYDKAEVVIGEMVEAHYARREIFNASDDRASLGGHGEAEGEGGKA